MTERIANYIVQSSRANDRTRSVIKRITHGYFYLRSRFIYASNRQQQIPLTRRAALKYLREWRHKGSVVVREAGKKGCAITVGRGIAAMIKMIERW